MTLRNSPSQTGTPLRQSSMTGGASCLAHLFLTCGNSMECIQKRQPPVREINMRFGFASVVMLRRSGVHVSTRIVAWSMKDNRPSHLCQRPNQKAVLPNALPKLRQRFLHKSCLAHPQHLQLQTHRAGILFIRFYTHSRPGTTPFAARGVVRAVLPAND